nr:PREDICTED: zinc finger BED domain-containing protein 5-like [Megachile rotundata]
MFGIVTYGIATIENSELRMCIICDEIFTAKSVSDIALHYDTNHTFCFDKSHTDVVKFLRPKAIAKTDPKTLINEEIRFCLRMSEHIVKSTAGYIITDSMIKLPEFEDVFEAILEDTAEYTTDKLLFNCVRKMSSDIKRQLIEKVCGRKFSLQYEITEDYELLINIKFLDENRVAEHFLSYTKLSTTATGLDIFNCVTARLEEHMLCWENCASLCVAGVSVMSDRIEEFYCKLNESCPTIEYTKCFTFRDEILMERMPMELEQVLDSVAEMVRYIVSSRVGLKVLKALCEVVDPYYETMIIHTDYWMFNSELLAKFYENRNELAHIFADKKPDFAALILDEEWCSKLAYLVDIFNYLFRRLCSEENGSIICWEFLLHFAIGEIRSWENDIKNNDVHMFPHLSDTDIRNIYPLILEHLKILQEILPRYLPTFDAGKCRWICKPFEVRAQLVSLFSSKEATELASLQSDSDLKELFEKTLLPVFWSSVKSEYPRLANIALHMLLHFSSARLLNREHSEMLNIKFKKISRSVDVEDELRLCLSYFRPLR